MVKRTIEIKISIKKINYRDNKDEIETNYRGENKINYRDFDDVDFKNIDLKITYNNILLSFLYLAKNPVTKDIASMIKFDII